MEKELIEMRIECEWHANSSPQEKQVGEELADIAGNWGMGIEVTVTKPFEYTQGPIQTLVTTEKHGDIRPDLS
jgi:hypothetical protein